MMPTAPRPSQASGQDLDGILVAECEPCASKGHDSADFDESCALLGMECRQLSPSVLTISEYSKAFQTQPLCKARVLVRLQRGAKLCSLPGWALGGMIKPDCCNVCLRPTNACNVRKEQKMPLRLVFGMQLLRGRAAQERQCPDSTASKSWVEIRLEVSGAAANLRTLVSTYFQSTMYESFLAVALPYIY